MDHCGIPSEYREAKLTEDSPAFGYVEAMPGNLDKGVGLNLFGPHGSGKTYAAAAIALAAMKFSLRVLYMGSFQLIEALKPDAPRWDDSMTMFQALQSRHLLVIDDIGSEYKGSKSGFSEVYLVNLLRHRVQNTRSTVMTTNLTGDEVEQFYGPGLRSLMNQMGPPVRMTGGDQRLEPAAMRKRRKDSGIK